MTAGGRKRTTSWAGVVAIALASLLFASTAGAHDWYTDVRNAAGERCCGERECAPLADDDVAEVAGGFLIKSLGITVPYARVQPSPDGRFHACVWWTPEREVRCFFSPEPGS